MMRPYTMTKTLQSIIFRATKNDNRPTRRRNINESETNYKTIGNAVGWPVEQQAQCT